MDKIKILVVDDERRMRKLVKDFLEREGYQVLEAGDGLEAMEACYAEKDIALIILDVMMPKMDGYELYLQVRARYPKTPVLLMTAFHYDKDHIIKRSRIEGLEGVIFKKPVDPDRLRQAIIESVKAR